MFEIIEKESNGTIIKVIGVGGAGFFLMKKKKGGK